MFFPLPWNFDEGIKTVKDNIGTSTHLGTKRNITSRGNGYLDSSPLTIYPQ